MNIFQNYKKKLSPSYFHTEMMKNMPKSLSFNPEMNFEEWRRKLLRVFKKLIGPVYKEKGKVEYRVLEREEFPDYILEKIIFPTLPDVINIGYLLRPKEHKEKYPGMICLQGHSPGAHISVGRAYTPVSYTHLTLPTTPYV